MEILVVEDDLVSSDLLTKRLTKLGHQVTNATDGMHALELVKDHTFRLVISDWMMPEMDGLELCQRIRSHHPEPYTYFLLLTARDSRDDRLEAMAAGADDFLTKPLDPADLTARLVVAQRILDMIERINAANELLERQQAQLLMVNQKLHALAATDGLTGLSNHRILQEKLEDEFKRAVRHAAPLSVIMLDVDYFKQYNDTFGHPAGDEVLKRLAMLLSDHVRDIDCVARYGGEEFAVLLPETDMEEALETAERLRAIILSEDWPMRPVTASFGVASLNAGTEHRNKLLREADEALYQSKTAGRNCVTAYAAKQESV
jgi:diguanylate cyclase (GGDEF)-like protein